MVSLKNDRLHATVGADMTMSGVTSVYLHIHVPHEVADILDHPVRKQLKFGHRLPGCGAGVVQRVAVPKT